MPPLDTTGRTTSFFEFWPSWLMYFPVLLQWLVLGLRYRSLSLPLIANPAIPLSGMVGVPNLGCRGAGVKLIADTAALEDYLREFPANGDIQFQQLAPWEPEAGVFWVRYPGEVRGQITSLTLKYTPYVVGDGIATLGQLVARDPRAGRLLHLYQQRHRAQWDRVLRAGEAFRLVFSASHCRGAVFRDGRHYITEALCQSLDRFFDQIPGFHYGRLDIKFRDLESLIAGEGIAVIEINGASAESIHIWDRNTTLLAALGTLLRQYRTLYALGDANRRLGHRPPGLMALWKAWRLESGLSRHYPAND